MSATSVARRQPTTNDNSNSNSNSKQRRISKRQQQQTTTATTTKQPVFYSSADTTFGFTTINDISGAGFFTVHAAPYIKNEICHGPRPYNNTFALKVLKVSSTKKKHYSHPRGAVTIVRFRQA